MRRRRYNDIDDGVKVLAARATREVPHHAHNPAYPRRKTDRSRPHFHAALGERCHESTR
jgi:hypothetical protein